MNIHPKLLPMVQAATDAGFTVHVPVKSVRPGQVGFVWVTREGMPGIAMMQIPTFPNFEPISIDVPVKPNRRYGSHVLQDYDGSEADAVRLLGELVASATVVPRFVGPHPAVPVDHRIPDDAEVYHA